MRTTKFLSFFLLAAVLWHGGCEVTPLAPPPVDPAAGVGGGSGGNDPASAANWDPPIIGAWDVAVRFAGDVRDTYLKPNCELRVGGEAWFVWATNYDGGIGMPDWGDSRVTRGADGKWRWRIPTGAGAKAQVWSVEVTPFLGGFSGTITTPVGVGSIMGSVKPPRPPKGIG